MSSAEVDTQPTYEEELNGVSCGHVHCMLPLIFRNKIHIYAPFLMTPLK